MIYKTYADFSPHARNLRRHFDRCFADPHRSHVDRFVWDYWHVPHEYTFLRTPAFQYFPKALYQNFHSHLVKWGRERLGCHDISPTWLSCYVEGCRQELHQDQPHGPLAFVLSLTGRRDFSGGHTIIKKPRGFHRIAPAFNRLIVFDPSLWHGVDQVCGVHDPRRGRLVLHGWFVNPRAFWVGGLTAANVERVMSEQMAPAFEDLIDLQGFCSWRLKIGRAGSVQEIRLLVDTLSGRRALAVPHLRRHLSALRFPRGRGATLTLPLMFS